MLFGLPMPRELRLAYRLETGLLHMKDWSPKVKNRQQSMVRENDYLTNREKSVP